MDISRDSAARPSPLPIALGLLVILLLATPLASAGTTALGSGEAACLQEVSESSLPQLEPPEALHLLHRGLECPVVDGQRGLQASLWSAIGRLSVGESDENAMQEARSVLWLTATLDGLRASIGEDPSRDQAITLLEETSDFRTTLQEQQQGYAVNLDPGLARTGISVLQDGFAVELGTWFIQAGTNGVWLDGSPLSEGERIASYQIAAQAYYLAEQYAFSAVMEGVWVEAEAPYLATLQEIERIEAETKSHHARWSTSEPRPLDLSALAWYGRAVVLERDLEWAVAQMEAFGEPSAPDLRVLQADFAVAKQEAGVIVTQVFLVVLALAMVLSVVILRAQSRWARDFHESTLGSELVWRNSP